MYIKYRINRIATLIEYIIACGDRSMQLYMCVGVSGCVSGWVGDVCVRVKINTNNIDY